MKKLLVLLVLAGLAYWLVKDRLGGGRLWTITR